MLYIASAYAGHAPHTTHQQASQQSLFLAIHVQMISWPSYLIELFVISFAKFDQIYKLDCMTLSNVPIWNYRIWNMKFKIFH